MKKRKSGSEVGKGRDSPSQLIDARIKEQGVSEEQALQKGMEEKSHEFVE